MTDPLAARRHVPALSRAALSLALLFVPSVAPAQPGDDWKYDVVVLKDGAGEVKGLLVDYQPGAARVEMKVIQRNPGERVRVIPRIFDRQALAAVRPLGADDRQTLLARLAALDFSGKDLARRIRELKFERITWDGNPRQPAYSTTAPQFILESNVREDLFRRTAVRLGQVYAAYNRALPPRYHATRPTRILLAAAARQYQAWLNERGHAFANPAFFDPARNEIVCGSDLERLGALLDEARAEHTRLREQIAARRADLEKLYRGAAVPREQARLLDEQARKIDATEAANDRLFEEATRLLWQRLTHEAFHAYLANFVYPPDHEDLPRWLNEGLAQIFETALLEGEELRIGHADPERLRKAQQALASGGLVPLTDLLRSTPRQFVVAHGGRIGRDDSERHYLAAWALSMYLAFEHKVLGTDALDGYARATFRKADPVASFCDLLGRKPEQLRDVEKGWHDYLRRLKPAGAAARTP